VARARRGEWKKAADLLDEAAGSTGVTDRHTQLACLHRLTGDNAGYEQLRDRSLALATPVTDLSACYNASRIATLVSTPVDPRPGEWCRRYVPKWPTAWNLHVLGRAHYRAGEFEQAIEACRRSLEQEPEWPGRILNWLLLAMAGERQGNTDDARKWLTMAVEWHEGLSRAGDPPRPICPPNLYVTDWLEFHVLLTEAKRTVRETASKK
jgi:tetratricopeptide (TPR) repeat protein